MMETISGILLKLFNMSITAGFIALAVVAFRQIFKSAPKKITCLMWGLVGLRLVFPFSIQSVLSLIPSRETLPHTIITGEGFRVSSGISIIDTPINSYLADHYYEGVTVPADTGANLMGVLSAVWLAGIAAMLIYAAVSVIRVKRTVSLSAPIEGHKNVYLADGIATAFIFGVIRPRIYLPSTIGREDIELVLAHEQAHLRRKDHIVKPLAFLLLCVYWFNPLIWLCFVLLCRDIESACDEKVLEAYETDVRSDYSKALIRLSTAGKTITACPLAFGETGVKERVKNVMNYKRPVFWIIIVAIVASAVVAVCFLTDPVMDKEPEEISSAVATELTSESETIMEYSEYVSGAPVKEQVPSATLEEAVHEAILRDSANNYFGEYLTEGHIIMGTKENGRETVVYALATPEMFAFVSNRFLSTGGANESMVLHIEKNEDGYICRNIEHVGMGSEYVPSIKRMFPLKYRNRVLHLSKEDQADLKQQCITAAQAYLDSLNRKVPICEYGDIPHTTADYVFKLTTEQSNNISAAIGKHTMFNAEKGNHERIEDGKRYVYETEFDVENEKVILTKYEYDTKKVVDYYELDPYTGELLAAYTVPKLFKPVKPSPDAPIVKEYSTIAATEIN